MKAYPTYTQFIINRRWVLAASVLVGLFLTGCNSSDKKKSGQGFHNRGIITGHSREITTNQSREPIIESNSGRDLLAVPKAVAVHDK